MDKLTVPQLTDSMNRMLESNASLLDDETSAGLMKVFGGGRFVDGQYVPLRNEKIKDVLRLSEGDRQLLFPTSPHAYGGSVTPDQPVLRAREDRRTEHEDRT